MKEKQLAKNTGSLFLFHIAKILFPFIVLPYLTRTMSTEAYGVVAYVKTVMTYMQVIVDFGFTLSATKDIVKAREDRTEMSFVIGDTLLAKLMLGAAGGAGLLILLGSLPLLRENPAYTLLSVCCPMGQCWNQSFYWISYFAAWKSCMSSRFDSL